MVSKKITLTIEAGLHARPASVLSKAATQCPCDVRINMPDRVIQVKSVLNLMVAAIKCGTEIELVCEGEDEENCLKTLSELIESGLGE